MKYVLSVALVLSVFSSSALSQQMPPPRELPEELLQQFADSVNDQAVVLSPEEYRQIRDLIDEIERAKSDRYDYAEPRISNQVISNEPGAEIPELSLGTNYNSYITFKDEAGNPWPIVHSNVGHSAAYTLNKINDYTFEVVVQQPNVFSNLTFMLEGYDGPIMINVGPPEHFIDYVKNYTIQGVGPATVERSRAASVRVARTHEQPSVNRSLSAFLNGIPPEDAIPVSVIRGVDVDMWVWDGRLVVRTQMRLLAPSADAEPLYGQNGWRVYSLRNPNSVLTFVHNNQTEMAFISESAISELRQQ